MPEKINSQETYNSVLTVNNQRTACAFTQPDQHLRCPSIVSGPLVAQKSTHRTLICWVPALFHDSVLIIVAL